ncbi:uncharacterized protein LOC125209521 [Salvia hispanica]|uniref:uncharacterized protein LOC125209521 n=1 Tax=Salvia hispanica TaxID=49212 RepID=UPI0020097531|nr:uncharacterized protein LOC125209521 [Salvia hispanica]
MVCSEVVPGYYNSTMDGAGYHLAVAASALSLWQSAQDLKRLLICGIKICFFCWRFLSKSQFSLRFPPSFPSAITVLRRNLQNGLTHQRLKSFTSQLHTECGILERIVYKHKNQHQRSSYFQYILKVRRDLQLLKSLNLDEVLESCFLVINGDRPKQKVQLLEGLKRRKTNSGKYNFLERLLGVTCLLSQIVEPLLKAAMEISMLLARSFFMKFSLVVLAVLARVRMLLDAVLLYNTISSLSLKEQSIKLKQGGFEVFREYFPRKEEAKFY